MGAGGDLRTISSALERVFAELEAQAAGPGLADWACLGVGCAPRLVMPVSMRCCTDSVTCACAAMPVQAAVPRQEPKGPCQAVHADPVCISVLPSYTILHLCRQPQAQHHTTNDS